MSPLGRQLYARPPGPETKEMEAALADARIESAEAPDDPALIVWVGRRLAYLWRMREAINVFTQGIASHPEYAPLYRHRGHRFISIRKFDDAIADLTKAAELIEGKPDEVEPDGQPNARNMPLATLGFSVWYHLGVARYAKGDFDGALEAFRRASDHNRGLDDNVAATTHWMYMCLRRLGRPREAAALLAPIHSHMDIIENFAYHRLTLVYKGLIPPDRLVHVDADGRVTFVPELGGVDRATIGYGVGNWHLYNGDAKTATAIFRAVVEGTDWPAFAMIAAEAGLARPR